MRVTIVTVCLNAAAYIEQAMHSVLAQEGVVDLEYILVDGGSTDNTVNLISSLAEIDPRIQLTTECEPGIARAMNHGLELATGDLIAYLHADDIYHYNKILIDVVEAFTGSSQASWLTGGVLEIDSQGFTLRPLRVMEYSYKRLLRNNIIFHPATFVRTMTLRELGGFDETLKYAMDYDLWLRLAQSAPPLPLRKTLTRFRVHEGGLSTRHRREALEEEYVVRKRYLSAGLGRLFHALYQQHRLRLLQ